MGQYAKMPHFIEDFAPRLDVFFHDEMFSAMRDTLFY